MKKKNSLKIISGILILAAVIILCILYPVLKNKDKNTNNNNTNNINEIQEQE